MLTSAKQTSRDVVVQGKSLAVRQRPRVPPVSASARQRQDHSVLDGKPGWRDQVLTSLCSVAAAAAATALTCLPLAAGAAPAAEQLSQAPVEAAAAAEGSSGDVVPIYFGNGCYWGRQYDFVNLERSLGRAPDQITSVVGYAGGRLQSPDGRVCYYYGPEMTVYEQLGHAEVVQVELQGAGDAAKQQFRKFADTYFSQFRRTPFGMIRSDPQDRGPGYRNVIGIPGGINSPFMDVLREANVNNMRLLEGRGNEYSPKGPTEDDRVNTVYVVDSNALPFYRAEQYHQFHNALGKKLPAEYTQQLKEIALRGGRINPTGCPEFNFSK